jgi:protein arginine kinase
MTNVGTGLRASVMMHLPALSMARRMAALAESLTRVGMTVRGLYGENTKAAGDLYQLSNQVTLGPTSQKIAGAVAEAARQVMALERNGRKALLDQNRLQMEDRVFRALGLLKFARRLSSREFMNLWSDLRLAVALELVSGLTFEQLDTLMIDCQPLELSAQAGSETKPEERDTLRAERVRSALAAVG